MGNNPVSFIDPTGMFTMLVLVEIWDPELGEYIHIWKEVEMLFNPYYPVGSGGIISNPYDWDLGGVYDDNMTALPETNGDPDWAGWGNYVDASVGFSWHPGYSSISNNTTYSGKGYASGMSGGVVGGNSVVERGTIYEVSEIADGAALVFEGINLVSNDPYTRVIGVAFDGISIISDGGLLLTSNNSNEMVDLGIDLSISMISIALPQPYGFGLSLFYIGGKYSIKAINMFVDEFNKQTRGCWDQWYWINLKF